jgi:hypothetical protein
LHGVGVIHDAGGLSDRGESRLESLLMKLTNCGYELEHFANSAASTAGKDHHLLLQSSPLREVRQFIDGKNILVSSDWLVGEPRWWSFHLAQAIMI